MNVSVVIPAYNGERFVVDAVNAALAQTLPPHEIVVVNDGSRDGTLEVLRGFGDRIRVIDQPNGGVQAARNRGIAAATGNWIALCDQDDLWSPAYLERAAALVAAAPHVDFVFANFQVLRNGVPEPSTKFDQAPPQWWDALDLRRIAEG
jgi:glycosyltransferase involved in cell wall biosynthesis